MNRSYSPKAIRSKLFSMMPWQVKYYRMFRTEKGRWPRLLKPQDYSDFIFRDNLLGRHNRHAFLADKYEVRKYVEGKGLGDILTKLYGVWDDANKIDFNSLPNQFALKCNHSCGMNIICYDKNRLNENDTKASINQWLNERHRVFYEQHYLRIKPLVICEELIPNNKDGFFPMDYKIHCANGKPVFVQCCFERTTKDAGRRVIYSLEWENLHLIENDSHYSDSDVEKPKHLKEMIEYASILSEGLDYARVDFYDTDDRVLFGEITLTPMGGWLSYFKQEALDIMGDAIRKNKK